MDNIMLALALIGLLGIACQWVAWWARLPAILFLLVSGILVGPVFNLVAPDRMFGRLLFPVVSLSVAVILFEGSLTLKFDEIRGRGGVVRNLITIGTLIKMAVIATATHYLMGFEVLLALLFGAVVVVTGPTVIIPLLRAVRPNARVANVLRWEGIIIDPIGALLAVLVFDFIISSHGDHALGYAAAVFGRLVLIGTCTGVTAAAVIGLILRRHLIPEYLRTVFTLTMVCGVFAISDQIAHESGLLAVTVMGMTLANMPDTDIDDILDFKESLSILLISILFIVLAARIELYELLAVGWPAMFLLLVIMFIARPLAVFASTLGSDLSLQERVMVAWIGPRGIVAAAVSAVFALRLEEAGFPEASLLVPMTFLVIIGTVIFQSITARPVATWLGVREPPPTGFLVIGAGIVARSIGKVLQDRGFKVIITDSNWENISIARMEGLDTYYGNPVSEHADRHLDLVGIGRLLAMSGRGALDALASLRYRAEFGTQNIYELQTAREQLIAEKHKISTKHRGQYLFGAQVTHGLLASWLRAGAEMRSTQLSEAFSFEDYLQNYADRLITLFAIDTRDRLHIFTADRALKPDADWTVISLIKPEADGETAPAANNS